MANGDKAAWRLEAGTLVVRANEKARGWLLSPRDYADFVLRFEFRFERGANSGVTFRARPDDNKALEIQLIDESGPQRLRPDQRTGALYGLAGVLPSELKPTGAWNAMKLEVRGPSVKVWRNGKGVLDTDLILFADRAATIPALTHASGRVGFQNWGGTVWFRKVEILDLAP